MSVIVMTHFVFMRQVVLDGLYIVRNSKKVISHMKKKGGFLFNNSRKFYHKIVKVKKGLALLLRVKMYTKFSVYEISSFF